MCPRDICPLVNGTVVGGYPTTSALGKAVGGKFQGFRGAEGHYPDSSGWLTISSDWQTTNSMYFAKTGWKLAYTIAPTASLPQIWAAVAEAEGIAAPNKNRARTWYWTGGERDRLQATVFSPSSCFHTAVLQGPLRRISTRRSRWSSRWALS